MVTPKTVVTVSGAEYELRRIPAREGAYYATLCMMKMIPAMAVPVMGGGMSQQFLSPDEYAALQRRMLGLCYRIDSKSPLPEPITNASGELIPALQYETKTVLELMSRAIGFNFTDFFGEKGMKLADVLRMCLGQNLLDSEASMLSSGDPSPQDSGATPN